MCYEFTARVAMRTFIETSPINEKKTLGHLNGAPRISCLGSLGFPDGILGVQLFGFYRLGVGGDRS